MSTRTGSVANDRFRLSRRLAYLAVSLALHFDEATVAVKEVRLACGGFRSPCMEFHRRMIETVLYIMLLIDE